MRSIMADLPGLAGEATHLSGLVQPPAKLSRSAGVGAQLAVMLQQRREDSITSTDAAYAAGKTSGAPAVFGRSARRRRRVESGSAEAVVRYGGHPLGALHAPQCDPHRLGAACHQAFRHDLCERSEDDSGQEMADQMPRCDGRRLAAIENGPERRGDVHRAETTPSLCGTSGLMAALIAKDA